ncbi:hypothetical protein COCC4DRAFT_54899 [Bipolaris maydis ATCC 48331]|uniref:Uncharacterized protein n=1 Tax=Cochliobolus heterostrophus (strain C4 / ATCC 48331 / race T) TaxID=665024 RepID=N4WE95_COCH4|nr:uncharacterized protein COCC4DRAFT_54899 [Bipolaris maydis ATCC 48331]ENH98563.1 hypothetical protein COCC4DRAFT_54899 [Bipolaris maydis ATCC 48331]
MVCTAPTSSASSSSSSPKPAQHSLLLMPMAAIATTLRAHAGPVQYLEVKNSPRRFWS